MDVDFTSAAGFTGTGNNVSPLCGFIVPGGPVRTDFTPADSAGTKRTLQMSSPGDLPSPLASVTELVCFLWPGTTLPPGSGVMVYYQITAATSSQPGMPPASTGFELLGALTPTSSSNVFRTGWATHEQLLEIMSSNIPVVVTFGLSVEPLSNIENIEPESRVENRMFVAQKIASDLFTFMRSFDTGGSGATQMVVPTNVFDRWLQRFEARFRSDPNFFLKSQSND